MALIPDDPNKAQAWVRGAGTPDMELDLYIPRGNKGDPGGIVLGTILAAGTDLDQILTDGIYRQPVASSATLLTHYPKEGVAGILRVHTRTTGSVEQVYDLASGGNSGLVFYTRVLAGGTTWSPWRAYASQRVAETAGRAIYTWDDLNGREQLTYGDTGRRNISGLGLNGWTLGYATIARRGSTVDVLLANTQGGAASADAMWTIPSGFRMTGSDAAQRVYFNETNATSLIVGAGGTISSTSRPGSNTNWHLTWQTLDPWPATLPGTASGTIPNL